MALGSLTYKTPVKIANIASDLTAKAGFVVSLTAADRVALTTAAASRPYGVIVVGCDSLTPGTYPSQIAAGALEIVDAYGATIVAIAGVGEWIVGYALSAAPAGESFLLSFQPVVTQA